MTAQTSFKSANQLLREGKLEAAIATYREAIAVNPGFSHAHHNLGEALVKAGRVDEAVAAFRRAVELNPQAVWSLFKLGELLRGQERFEQAVGFLRRAVELKSEVAEFNLGLGAALLRLGSASEEAEACLRRAVELNPFLAEAFYFLGVAASGRGQWSEAVEFYGRGLEVNPSGVECGLGLAEALGKLGRWSEAVERYGQMELASGPSGEVCFGLGQAHAQLGRWEEAVVEYGRAVALGFAGAEVRHHLGYALGQLGRWEEAVVEYRLVVEVNPRSAPVRHQLGYALMQLGRWGEAAVELRRSVELYPGSAVVWQQLGDVLRELGEDEEAVGVYRRALELQPGWREVEEKLSLLQSKEIVSDRFALGVPQKIANPVEQQLNQENHQIDPWIAHQNLAEQFQAQGKLNEAIEAYRHAIDINPSYFKSYHGLGEVLQAQGKLSQALEAYSRALELKPDFSRSRQKLEQAKSLKNNRHNFLYILDTHQGDPSGLGVVASRFSPLGQLITDGTEVKGKVFIPGRPDYYSNLVRKDNINYILTMFESSRIPPTWVEAINNNFTEVFVPHKYVRKTFQDSGVVCPISVLPLAYPERKRVLPMSKQPGKLRLGYLCGPTKRKNVELLIQAVEELCQEGKRIELFIHCNWLKPEQNQWSKLPFVNLTEGKLSDDFINQWYSQLDAYICPSSGEGWSLTPRESMSLGIPTIISDIEVHQELLESGFYLPIASDDWQPAYYEFLKGNCGEWKAYSVQQIKGAIAQMIDDYDYWYSLAQTGKNWVASKYKWESVERQLLAEIYPKHLLLTMPGNEDIDNYCQSLVSLMPKTKYVRSYHQLESILQRESIQSIHVQYDSRLFNSQELLNNVNQLRCLKKITIHPPSDTQDVKHGEMLSIFDEIYVFTAAQMQKNPLAKCVSYNLYSGSEVPPIESLHSASKALTLNHLRKLSKYPPDLHEDNQFRESNYNVKSLNTLGDSLLHRGRLNEASFYYQKAKEK